MRRNLTAYDSLLVFTCLCVCFQNDDGKTGQITRLLLHNKASLSSFPLLGARRVYNPLNITCWKGSFMSSRWSNHKISLPNYPSTFLPHPWPTGSKWYRPPSSLPPHRRLRSNMVSKEATLNLEVPGLCPSFQQTSASLLLKHPWIRHHALRVLTLAVGQTHTLTFKYLSSITS